MTGRFFGVLSFLACFFIGGAHPSMAITDRKFVENSQRKFNTGVSDVYFHSDNILFLFGDEKRRHLYLTNSMTILVRACRELVRDGIFYPVTIYLVDGRSVNKPRGEWIEVDHIYCNAGAPEP